MVTNKFYKCKVCGEIIRIRYQVGYCEMPINVYCPKCNTHFSGVISPKEDLSILFSLNNVIECDEVESGGYTIELSPEFLTLKYQINKSKLFPGLTPFMRFRLKNNNDADDETIQRTIHLAIESNNYANQIETLFNLLDKNDIPLIRNYLNSINNEYISFFKSRSNLDNISTKLDFLLFIKQYTKSLINSSLLDSTHSRINTLFESLDKIRKRNDYNEYKRLLKFLDQGDYFSMMLNEIPKYIVNFIDNFKQFVPCYLEYKNASDIDYSEIGISCADAGKMCELYSNGFELLGRIIDPSIALDNLLIILATVAQILLINY